MRIVLLDAVCARVFSGEHDNAKRDSVNIRREDCLLDAGPAKIVEQEGRAGTLRGRVFIRMNVIDFTAAVHQSTVRECSRPMRRRARFAPGVPLTMTAPLRDQGIKSENYIR